MTDRSAALAMREAAASVADGRNNSVARDIRALQLPDEPAAGEAHTHYTDIIDTFFAGLNGAQPSTPGNLTDSLLYSLKRAGWVVVPSAATPSVDVMGRTIYPFIVADTDCSEVSFEHAMSRPRYSWLRERIAAAVAAIAELQRGTR